MGNGQWVVAALALAAAPAGAQVPDLPLVPWPARVTRGDGAFAITSRTPLVLRGTRRAELDRLGRLARELVRDGSGQTLIPSRRERPRALVLALGNDTASEAYSLRASADSLVISAAAPRGLFYGLQTLRQLMSAQGSVPAVYLEDVPRFGWRGMHLDVGRHLFPVPFIKRYLDLMARYKLNTFHWHLTEDQGWRLEIRSYPRLTQVGAWRRETMVEKNFEPYLGDGRRYGGFYTQAEVRQIVRYAAERHITVVPEIDMPGHMLAALAAYPEFACTPGPFQVGTRWGVFDDILCPSEATFTFLERVLAEVLELFPSTFVHIGGDEAPKARWRASPLVQDIIRREGLRNEEEVQGWFNRRIERFLVAQGRRPIGWDEILEGGLAPNAAVMSWRGTRGGIEAARAGHDVVMTPTSHAYFDYYQGEARFEPLAIGGFLPLETVYGFEPVPDSLGAEEARRILGAQGNVWTEYMPTAESVEYMALPRMLALAEVVWSPRDARDWGAFAARLPARLRELDLLGVGYRIPHVTGLEEDRLALDSTVIVTLGSALPDAVIRYTTDGTDPVDAATLWVYTAPFRLQVSDTGTTVTARAFLPSGRASPPRAARFTRATLRAPASVDEAALMPGARVELVEGRFSRLAELDTARARRDTALDDVGWPAFAPEENFGLRIAAYLRIPADGVWRFRLTSDDGSGLWIGENPVVDNDGLHGALVRTGLAALRAGYHPIRIAYFQRGGGKALGLEIERDDGTGRQPAAALLFRHR